MYMSKWVARMGWITEQIQHKEDMKRDTKFDFDSYGVAYAKPVEKIVGQKSKKAISRRESMLKDLPAPPKEARSQCELNMKVPSGVTTHTTQVSKPSTSTKTREKPQTNTHTSLLSTSKRLLSLVRPDSWNVLSIADLQHHRQAQGPQTKPQECASTLSLSSSLRRKHSQRQNLLATTVRPVVDGILSEGVRKMKCVQLTDVPEDCAVDATPKKVATRPIASVVKASSSVASTENGVDAEKPSIKEHLMPDPVIYKLLETKRRPPDHLRDLLLSRIAAELMHGLLSGTIDVSNSLGTKTFVLNQSSSSTAPASTMRSSIKHAIIWLLEAQGWSITVKLTWRGGIYLRKIKYRLSA